ncbi:MAG: hypothetical protein ACOC2W_02045 [bacterium]
MSKRFVTKNSWELGIDSTHRDDNNKEIPTWYVYDKKTKEISDEGDYGQGARSRMKKICNQLNENPNNKKELF